MIQTSTRPERRRAWLRPNHEWVNRGDILIRNGYGQLIGRYPRGPKEGRSKYTPHIGAKQRAKGLARMVAA